MGRESGIGEPGGGGGGARGAILALVIARDIDLDRGLREQVKAWAANGAMALTGRPGGSPLGPPAGLVPKLVAIADRISPAVNPLMLLAERAAIAGLQPGGDVSCGGATRLLSAGERWVAVTLARTDDVDLVPAWLCLADPPADPWAAIRKAISTRPLEELVDDALLVGLPIGVLPHPAGDTSSSDEFPLRRTLIGGPTTTPGPLADLVVADLTSLWAGPLCGSLLAAAGATVIKVESMERPDGARFGPPAFFDLLNARKRSVALDLRTRDGVGALRSILSASDVVLEASRPRALEQMGIDASRMLASGRTRVWASITGHGRSAPGRERVGFGDDAAAAGGLVCWDDDGPVFCADAVADPTSGLVAAAGVLEALADGGRWLLDVSMAEVAAHLAGPTLPAVPGRVAAPIARIPIASAPQLGEHTAAVLADLPR